MRLHIIVIGGARGSAGQGPACGMRPRRRVAAPATITAIDSSEAALAVARRNAARHDVSDRVRLVRADLLDAITGPFDAIVSNPPYVPAPDMAGLQPEVRDYEPTQALVAGDDGLDAIRRLVPGAAAALRPGGWLLFEFGFGQSESVRRIIEAEPRLALVEIRPDLAGIPRVAVARRVASFEVS